MSEINSTILDNKLSELLNEATNYYNTFVEKQEEEIDLSDDFYCIDYLDHSLGILIEAQLITLKKDGIVALDRQLGENVEIDFNQLTINDKIVVLEIYENNFEL